MRWLDVERWPPGTERPPNRFCTSCGTCTQAGLNSTANALAHDVASLQVGTWAREVVASGRPLLSIPLSQRPKEPVTGCTPASACPTSSWNACPTFPSPAQNELRRKEGELEDARQRAAAGDEASGQLQFLQEAVRDMEAQVGEGLAMICFRRT